MTATWPAVVDLGDITRLPLRRFNPDQFPVRRDTALEAEKTTEQLLAECRQIRADLAAAVAQSRRARGADELREVA